MKQELSPRNAAIAAAKSDLETSRQWLENIPLDADWQEIARHQIILAHWPDRIQRLVAERNQQ